MTSKSKRMLTAILAVVMLFTTLIPMSAFAADVTMDLSKAKVSWDFTLTDAEGNTFTAAYGLKAEDNPYGYAMTPSAKKMHDYTAKAPGLSGSKSDWEYGKDYVYAFCIEHGIPLPDSDNYSASSDPTHGNKYEMLSAEQKNLLSLALAYGYPNRTDLEDSKDANACYSAKQLIIWQISFGFRTSATQLNDKTYPMDGYTGTMTEQYTANKYLKDFYDRILSDMATHYTRPSFAAGVPASAKNYEMEYSNGKYSVTLTDTNHVLSKYRVTSNGGVSVSVSGNTLTISSSQPLTDAVTIKLNRRMPATTHTTGFLIWSVAGKENNNQDMVSGVPADNDPVPSYLKVSTAAGSVKIVKESEDGVVDGIRFNVTGNGVDQTVTTKNGGVIQIDNLRPGTYTVTELTENRYEPQAPKTVTVVSGQTASVLFSNTLKRGDLKIVKTAEDGKVSGVPFTVTGNGVNENVITNSKGEILIEGLLPGTYTVTEHNENYYEPQEVRTVTVVYDEVATVTFSNVLKRGDLTVNKIAEDGLHEGSKFRLYGTADCGLAVNEYAVVDSTGKAYFRDVLIGSGYVLEEVDTAVRYVIPDALTVNIEWNKVTETSVDNILKKWRAEVMKVDRDLYYGNEPGYGGEEPMLLSLKSDAIVEQYGYPYGVAQGDATLAGHTYGVFDGDRLVDTYVTDENGYFITDYYLIHIDVVFESAVLDPSLQLFPKVIAIIHCQTFNVCFDAIMLIGGKIRLHLSQCIQRCCENGMPFPVNDGNAITNEIIRGDIIGKKLDEDGFAICGALFGLFRESETVFTEDTALLTCESNEIGVFFFEDVPFGRWIVREIKAAPAFVLNENNYAVTVSEHEEVIDIVIENEFITGSVQLTKVDKEYPDNKLAGAIFEVYVDVDGDRVFNAEVDKFVGEMTEVETGVYRMDDLRYNGYFCYEKTAPEGFLKDENYHYFEIRNDGETVTVENEAGVGFVNQPITGELELTKKDISDGKLLANVGFRIRNEVGEIVAEGYTDENGIAKFTLRYGKYTYQEFDGLDGYIIDENEYAFEIKENGEIVKAEMTNEKIPQPDNPQTGDNSRLDLWVGLAAASLGALIVLAFGTKKKRTKTK